MSGVMGKGARAKPFTLGGPTVIVAVDDADLTELEPALRKTFESEGVPFEVVPASSLENPYTEADFYLGSYRPTEPGCVRLFQTGALELYEQAPDGRVLRGGRPVWAEAPVATGRPTANTEGPLVLGEDAALCFWTGGRLRVTVAGPLLQLWHQPVLRPGPAPVGWMEHARAHLTPVPKPS